MCQLQQELSEAKTVGHTVTEENNQKEVEANLQAELDSQRRDLEVEHHKKMTSQREEMVRTVLINGKNSQFIHILTASFLTKFTFSKSHFPQNSHF